MKFVYAFLIGGSLAAIAHQIYQDPSSAWVLGTTLLAGVVLAIILRA